jgi:hypothetical protein
MSATQPDRRGTEEPVSGWAVGALAFAATMMVLIGSFQMLTGLVAVINDDFFVVARNYTFDLDVSAWGWIHLVLGAAILATGFGLFMRAKWAAVTAIVLAAISALENFFFIPYYPIWSLVLIALDMWVIWALTRPGIMNS